jgi:hypothetical protein
MIVGHISKSQMERYRERQLRGDELFAVNRHLTSCDECRSEYNSIANTDSAAVLHTMLHPHWLSDSAGSPDVATLQPRFGKLSFALGIALVVVIGLTVALVLRASRSRSQEAQVVTDPTEIKGPLPSLPPSPEASSSVVGGPNQEQQIAQTTHLQKPQALARVVRNEIVTLKGPSGDVVFSLLRPVGTYILGTQPTLAWSPVKDAAKYEVSMRPLKGTRSIFTTTVEGTSYTLPPGLVDAYRDQVLQWSVTAQLSNGGEVTAPGIAAPEALFVISDATKAHEIEVRAQAQPNVLGRATVFANAGILDEAEREINSYLQKHPTDKTARDMLLTIKSWRGKK